MFGGSTVQDTDASSKPAHDSAPLTLPMRHLTTLMVAFEVAAHQHDGRLRVPACEREKQGMIVQQVEMVHLLLRHRVREAATLVAAALSEVNAEVRRAWSDFVTNGKPMTTVTFARTEAAEDSDVAPYGQSDCPAADTLHKQVQLVANASLLQHLLRTEQLATHRSLAQFTLANCVQLGETVPTLRDNVVRLCAAAGLHHETKQQAEEARPQLASQPTVKVDRAKDAKRPFPYPLLLEGSPEEHLLRAVHYASHYHDGQLRKNPAQKDYITHPLEVTRLLMEHGETDVETLMAAVCHDVLEDTKAPVHEMSSVLGPRVVTLVQELSDDKSLSKIARKQHELARAATCSRAAKRIKVADKTSNLRDLFEDPPTSWSVEMRRGYAHWALAVCLAAQGELASLDKHVVDLCEAHGVRAANLTTELERYYRSL